MKIPGGSVMTKVGRPDQLAAEYCETRFTARVLNERERWATDTQKALTAGIRAVVRLSARMPATLRTRGLAYGPVKSGAKAFVAECRCQGLSLQHLGPGRGALGPWVLWASENDPILLKQAALLIEEGSRQGQLLDLDVCGQEGLVSRSVLGLPPRPCIVCGQPAAVCTGRSIHEPSIVEAAFLALLKPGSTTFPNAVEGHSRIRLQDTPGPNQELSPEQFQFFLQDLRADTPLAQSRP